MQKEKAFDQIQHPSVIKNKTNLGKLELGGLPQPDKGGLQKTHATLGGEGLTERGQNSRYQHFSSTSC